MKTIRNLSITGKTAVAFATVIIAFLLSAGICLYSVWAIDQQQNEMAASENALLLIKDGTADYLNIIWAVLANNLDGKAGHKDWIIKHIGDFPARLSELRAVDGTSAGAGFADMCLQQYDIWRRTVVDPLVDMRKKVDEYAVNMSDLSAMTEGFGSYLGTEKLIASVGKLEDYEKNRMLQSRNALDSLRTTMYASIVAASAIAVLAAVFAGYWLARSIRIPLDRAMKTARLIAEGRLESGETAFDKDETGRLLNEIQQMQLSLIAIVKKVRSGCESVKAGSSHIAAGSADLSSRTEQQAASLEETASSMAQLTQTVAQTASNARLASDLSREARTITEAGNDAVQALVRTNTEISENSEKIAEITSLIEGIAFQTNILALNASVEAARAGELGRGFAVVAAEVRDLAQRSASAAKEAKERIARSTELAAGGSEKATAVRAAMDEIKRSIEQVSQIVGEIAVAAEEQRQGIEQVNRAVVYIDDVTQQNAALVEQTAATAQQLDDQAVNLNDAVAIFRFR
jgi:methyl-accepting chemotaxis protein